MTFQFKPLANPEVSNHAYELPAMPCGVSGALAEAIDTYAAAVRNGPDGSENEPYQAVTGFDARSVPDVIAKFLIKLHYDFPGLDNGGLALAATEANYTRLIAAEGLLADLYRQIPTSWGQALDNYRASLLAEADYDRLVWRPAFNAEIGGARQVSSAISGEMERLGDIRAAAEEFLLAMPAPSLEEFAAKYLIAFSHDRDLNGYHEEFCAEARRLMSVDDGDTKLSAILSALSWGE
ncbi:hypothetical protein [Sphingobium sp. CAP-1]|uniref:hypothetical protein n=1 Tax=Sphingobium sp. CAP-1 TaxID=2676077 RepID=UPI0012BB3C36|nr:hypothetical protein [Sphingobium sp. CAP-1]QGP80023.1 hypothetical protein GL174_14280 [Sphingobium sp. CAP-1]